MEFFKNSRRLPVASCQLAVALLFAWVALAQAPAGVAHIAPPAAVQAKAHASATAIFTVSIDAGFHIQSNHPKLDYLIPTSLSLTPAGGISLAMVAWPAAQDHKFSFAADQLAVFEGKLQVPVSLKTGAPGSYTLHGSFRYQACNDQLCRPPVTEPFTLSVQVH